MVDISTGARRELDDVFIFMYEGAVFGVQCHKNYCGTESEQDGS